MTTSTSNKPWKEPTQDRGRQRVQLLLTACRDIVAEEGHLDFKMTSVAKRAGVPVGSLYQFFPTRAALLARLFHAEMEVVDGSLARGLASTPSVAALISGIAGLLRRHLDLLRDRPVLMAIWGAPGLEPELQKADLENSQHNGELIANRVIALAERPVDEAALRSATHLICHLWGHALRLCVLAPDESEGTQILDQYAAMIQARLRDLAGA